MSVTKERVAEQAIEIREQDGQFYASSPRNGWYFLQLEDATHTPFCECPHHVHRLKGTKIDCKHLAALRAYLAEQQIPRCPCCRQALPEPVAQREPLLTDAELRSIFR